MCAECNLAKSQPKQRQTRSDTVSRPHEKKPQAEPAKVSEPKEVVEEQPSTSKDEIPAYSAWEKIVRAESAKNRRKRELVIAGLKIPGDIAGDYAAIYNYISQLFTTLDFKISDSLRKSDPCYFGYVNNFSWRFLGSQNQTDQRPPLILVTFDNDVTPRNLLRVSYLLGRRETQSKYIFLRESLSKEERKTRALQRLKSASERQ